MTSWKVNEGLILSPIINNENYDINYPTAIVVDTSTNRVIGVYLDMNTYITIKHDMDPMDFVRLFNRHATEPIIPYKKIDNYPVFAN